jgi:hypothetical protein
MLEGYFSSADNIACEIKKDHNPAAILSSLINSRLTHVVFKQYKTNRLIENISIIRSKFQEVIQ